jgi:hypothetical protein
LAPGAIMSMGFTAMNISQSSELPDLLTSDEVIQRLCADSALRRVAISCVLPAVRFADEWRFRRSDLDAWIMRQKSVTA